MTTLDHNSGEVVASVLGLVRTFGARRVIDRLNLSLHRGEIVALVGHSGCGKTTFLRTLAGLDVPDGGTLSVPSKVSVVFQEPRLLPWRKVRDNVTLGQPQAHEQATAILTEVGLSHRLDAWPITLSGGEAQRVALARALMSKPDLLLMDEPFAALDALTRLKMHGLIRDLILRHRPATLLVTHDVDEAIFLADRIIAMRDGRIAREFDVAAIGHDRDTPAVTAIRKELLIELGVDLSPAALENKAPNHEPA